MPTKRDPIEFPQKYAESAPHYLIYSPFLNLYLALGGWTKIKSEARRYDEIEASDIVGELDPKLLTEYCGHIARRIG